MDMSVSSLRASESFVSTVVRVTFRVTPTLRYSESDFFYSSSIGTAKGKGPGPQGRKGMAPCRRIDSTTAVLGFGSRIFAGEWPLPVGEATGSR